MTKFDQMALKHCRTDCHNIATKCPLGFEFSINWCPKCFGVVYERNGAGDIVRFSGGFIPVVGKDHGYEWLYACDCEMGNLRQLQKFKKYVFEDDPPCFFERTLRLIEKKYERAELMLRPAYSNHQERINAILARITQKEQEDV